MSSSVIREVKYDSMKLWNVLEMMHYSEDHRARVGCWPKLEKLFWAKSTTQRA